MKTTLQIDDQVMPQLKRESGRQGRTMSELVETALRAVLERGPGLFQLSWRPSIAIIILTAALLWIGLIT